MIETGILIGGAVALGVFGILYLARKPNPATSVDSLDKTARASANVTMPTKPTTYMAPLTPYLPRSRTLTPTVNTNKVASSEPSKPTASTDDGMLNIVTTAIIVNEIASSSPSHADSAHVHTPIMDTHCPIASIDTYCAPSCDVSSTSCDTGSVF